MNFAFGAMTAGGYFQHGIKVWGSRLPVLFVIVLIFHVPTLMGELLFPLVAYRPGAGLGTQCALQIFLGLIQTTFQSLSLAAVLCVVTQALAGRSVTLADALNFALSRWMVLVPASFVLGLAMALPILLGMAPGLFLLDSTVGIIVFSLGALAGMAAAIYLLTGLLFTPQAVMADNTDVIGGLRRSLQLTAGRRLNVFVVLLLMGLVIVLLSVPGFVIKLVLPHAHDTAQSFFTPAMELTNYFNYLIFVLLNYPLTCLAYSLTSVVWTLLYFDARARLEPLDLAQLAQQQVS